MTVRVGVTVRHRIYDQHDSVGGTSRRPSLKRLPRLFLCKLHACHCAYCSDACEENNLC
jgi:hypothetical protein